ncbi:MAG TPA: peptide deformylase [Desulfatiglandales bacterium]|nr:peptide deformylase [Desulfatiglandales bacterium]
MEIVTYPNPILTKKAEPVENIDEDIQNIIDGMATMMYQASGIGLAANQVGIAKRIIVFDINYKEKGKDLKVLINPTILLAEDKTESEEGCLSVPDFQGKIFRKRQIKAQGVDRTGKPIDIDAEDLLAICIQHEIDHINGTLILDHVSYLKRNIYKRRIEKLLKKER